MFSAGVRGSGGVVPVYPPASFLTSPPTVSADFLGFANLRWWMRSQCTSSMSFSYYEHGSTFYFFYFLSPQCYSYFPLSQYKIIAAIIIADMYGVAFHLPSLLEMFHLRLSTVLCCRHSYYPNLYMGKLRLRECQALAQGLTAINGRARAWTQTSLTTTLRFLKLGNFPYCSTTTQQIRGPQASTQISSLKFQGSSLLTSPHILASCWG